MPLKTLRDNLKHLRKIKGFTQVEVSGLIGTNSKMAGHHETGYVIPSTEHLQNYSQLYGVTIDTLVRKKISKK